MKREQLIHQLADFLKQNGSENTAMLISDAIEQAYQSKTTTECEYYHRAVGQEVCKIGDTLALSKPRQNA